MTEIHLMSLFLTCLSSINGSNSNWLSRMMTFSSWIQQEGWTRRSPSRGLEIRNLQQEKDSSPQTILTVRAGDANSWVVGYLWRYQPYWNWKCYLDSEVSLLDGPVQWLPPLHRPLTRLDMCLQIDQRHLKFLGLLWKIWHLIFQNKSWDPCILVTSNAILLIFTDYCSNTISHPLAVNLLCQFWCEQLALDDRALLQDVSWFH